MTTICRHQDRVVVEGTRRIIVARNRLGGWTVSEQHVGVPSKDDEVLLDNVSELEEAVYRASLFCEFQSHDDLMAACNAAMSTREWCEVHGEDYYERDRDDEDDDQ